MEENKVKKTTAKAKKTTKADDVAKVVKEKDEVKKQDLTINDIPQDLIKQMFEMFQSMQNQNNNIGEIQEQKPNKITKAYLRKIKDREVIVRSVAGVVSFKSPKTSTLYKWMEIGDEESLTIDEILTMDSTSKRFLNTPWLMIDDDEVVEGLGLTDLYNVITKIEDVDILMNLGVDEIESLVNKAPYEYKKMLSSVIFAKISANEIRDIVLIKEFERILGVTLLI